MGTKLKELIEGKEIELEDLSGRTIVIDGMNQLYQFLTIIRQPDGTPFTDKDGNVTSHLMGLFYRLTNFIENNIKMVYVFDGKHPELKGAEIEIRKERKEEARIKYEKAKKEEDTEAMKKYATMTAQLTKDMVIQAKELLDAFGIPWIDALSEGESQAVHIVNKNQAYAVVSQDYDSLLFGAKRMIKNLSISGKRKRMGKAGYKIIKPELIDLKENLDRLKINNDQLILIAILVGTDFNPGGIKGIGQNKALALIKKHEKEKNFNKMCEKIFKDVKWGETYSSLSWKEIFDLFKNMPIKEKYDIEQKQMDAKKVEKLLLDYGFSKERVESALKKIQKKEQKGLGEFFK